MSGESGNRTVEIVLSGVLSVLLREFIWIRHMLFFSQTPKVAPVVRQFNPFAESVFAERIFALERGGE